VKGLLLTVGLLREPVRDAAHGDSLLWRLFFADAGAEVAVNEIETGGVLGEGWFVERRLLFWQEY
jgi:hypothetical protein